MEDGRITLPDDLVRDIKERYCAGKRRYTGPGFHKAIIHFAAKKLFFIDKVLCEYYQDEKNQPSVDTIYKALNSKKPYGIYCKGDTNLLDLLCYFSYNSSWLKVAEDKGISNEILRIESNNNSLTEELKNVIRNACLAEFNAYKAIPHIETEELYKYYLEGSSGFNRLYTYMIARKKANQIINNEFNPSDFEIYSINVTRVTDTDALIETSEYWLLQWYDTTLGNYDDSIMYNAKNRQTYKLVKMEGCWKIKSVHFPENKDS